MDEIMSMVSSHLSIIMPLARHYAGWALDDLTKETKKEHSHMHLAKQRHGWYVLCIAISSTVTCLVLAMIPGNVIIQAMMRIEISSTYFYAYTRSGKSKRLPASTHSLR